MSAFEDVVEAWGFKITGDKPVALSPAGIAPDGSIVYSDAESFRDLIGAEPELGNPSVSGWILSSSSAGVRSWVAPNAHSHAIADVTGLQAALDARSLTSHNHTLDSLSNTTITSIATGEILRWNGTAWVNNTLAEAGIQPAGSYLTGNQTITLSGIVTGSGATAITTSIADAALSIAKTSGLQSALDARMATASYPDLVAIEALAGTSGLLRKTAANTWSLDTASYALSSAIPVASSTTPSALGTASVGTGTTWARADHVHAMPTAAQVGAAASAHSHAIADVTGLQAALDARSLTSHNHTLDSLSNTTITSIATGEILRWNGTAWVNNTLAEAGIQPAGSYLTGNQTITLSGIVTGSGATAITTSIADAALSIAKTSGLQSALDARMATASYPDLVAIEALAGTSGLLRKTAANTWSLDTASYALSSAIPVASSTTPSALGTASVGTGTTWARADHVHAMPTAAQVGAAASAHSHAIADVTGLQAALDARSLTSHNHTLDSLSNTTITSIATGEILRWNGTAWVNNTLAEAGIQPAGSYLTGNQTITLSGIVTGSGATAITTSIADAALSIAKTSGLQSALDARMATASYPDLVAIEALAGTSGLLRKTAANTWSLDTASYALSSAIPVASSTTPSALGTASVGTGTTWARADHVHAMPTAAQVGAAAASHNHDAAYLGISATAAAAMKLATGRTIGITGDATWTSPAFDGTANVTAALTLASVITAGGPVGGAATVPVITYDAKGRLTAVTTATITPAAIGAQPAGSYASSSHNHTLDSLSNTTITSIATGELLRWNGTAWVNNTLAEAGIQPAGSYLTGNQTITLSGIVTGSGATAITTSIADGALSIAKTSGLQGALDARMSTASYPDLVAIEALAGTSGLLRKTAANTWSLDTASYALSSAIPAASSTTPSALGTAAVGSGTTWARADHVHAMPTAAQVGAVPSSSGVVGVMLPSSTSFASSFTQDIFGTTASGYFLREVRTNANAPSSLLGNYASGIAWKGEDTYGSLMVAYNSSNIRVSGGNGSNPVWTVDLWHTGKFTQTDLSKWDIAYTHSQIATGNPHGTTFAQLASKPTTLSGYGITDAASLTSTNYGTTFESTDPFAGTNRGTYDGKGGVRTWNGAGPFGSVWYNVVDCRHRNTWGSPSDIFGGELAWGMTAYTDRLAFRSRNATGTATSWTEVWTKSNLPFSYSSPDLTLSANLLGDGVSGGISNKSLGSASAKWKQVYAYTINSDWAYITALQVQNITLTGLLACAFVSINDSSTYILPDSDPVGSIRIVNGTPAAGWNPKVTTSQYVYLTYSLADGSAYNEQGGIIPVPKRNYMFQKVASDRWCVLGVVS